MKLSTISKLAAVAALCVAGYVDAHAQTALDGASAGNNGAPTGNCAGLGDCGYSVPGNGVIHLPPYYEFPPHYESIEHTHSVAVIAAYQKQLASHAATAATLIEDNAEILSPSCLVEVETLQRSLRNAYSSTGGQLPLNEPPFDRHGPEFRGYVAALADQSRKTSAQIESMVTYNCRDPNATAFYKGEVWSGLR